MRWSNPFSHSVFQGTQNSWNVNSISQMLYFLTKVNHPGSTDRNEVYQIVPFPRIQVSQTYLTSESIFLKQILQEQHSFRICFGKPKFKLTDVQALYIVLGPKATKACWLVYAGFSVPITPPFFHNRQSSFSLRGLVPSCFL